MRNDLESQIAVGEKLLYKSNQHPIILLFKVPQMLISGIILGGVGWMIFDLIGGIFGLIIGIILAFVYFSHLWKNSFCYVSDRQVGLFVRNGLFANYLVSTPMSQIRSMAYSRNHFIHYWFDCGNFFCQTTAGTDVTMSYIRNIKQYFDVANAVFHTPETKRSEYSHDKATKQYTKEELIEKETKTLENIQGICEVYLVSNEDRRYIFENEEDRNHGVYEAIKRDIVLCATHDSTFRDPDERIVIKLGNKVIFPAVGFHEIKQKNVVSSSPGIEVHKYLVTKLKNFHDDDATLLIGFDI